MLPGLTFKKIQFSGYSFFFCLLDFMLECISLFSLPLKLTLKGYVFALPLPPNLIASLEKKGKEQMRNGDCNIVIDTNLFGYLGLTVKMKCYSDAILVQNGGSLK